MKSWLIRKLGGFATLDEAIDEIQRKDGVEKKIILTEAVKKLFNTVSSDDILKEVGNKWYFEGRELLEGDKEALIIEAENFLRTKLWKILQKDVKYQANRRMYLNSVKDDDLIAGKLWLFTLDTLKTRLESMKKKSGLYNRK